MMPKANPDVTLRIPQTQLQAAQARLTDYLLQSQYAFVQSFSGGLDTIVDIFVTDLPASRAETVQLVLCPAMHGTSVHMTQDRTVDAVSQSTHMTTLIERLVAVCTPNEGTLQ